MARPGTRIPAVTLYAEKEEIETAFGIATKSWICMTCKKEFSLLESMGDLSCSQHPGFIQENGVWSCCGQKIVNCHWDKNEPIRRMYDNNTKCYPTIPHIRGCQRCDHNTSCQKYTFKDTTNIADLSALLPFLNKEFPFVLRKGFKNGNLFRCARRQIVIPEKASIVFYQDENGELQEWDVPDGPDFNSEEIPIGIEYKALSITGTEIKSWWPQKPSNM